MKFNCSRRDRNVSKLSRHDRDRNGFRRFERAFVIDADDLARSQGLRLFRSFPAFLRGETAETVFGTVLQRVLDMGLRTVLDESGRLFHRPSGNSQVEIQIAHDDKSLKELEEDAHHRREFEGRTGTAPVMTI